MSVPRPVRHGLTPARLPEQTTPPPSNILLNQHACTTLQTRRQPLLLIRLRRIPYSGHILPRRIIRRINLIKRIIGVLLKLLPNLSDLLIPPEALLILHLVQPALLVRRIGRLEAALRVAVKFVLSVGCDVECVECVLDTRGVERGGLAVEGAEGRVDAAGAPRGLLLGFLCAGALGLGGEGGFFLGEEEGFFLLLAFGFLGLCGGGLAGGKLVHSFLRGKGE
jgi:hypothetical protein